MESLKNKTVLITGASQGLGRALSELAARKGAKVVLVARNKNDLDEVVKDITARGGQAFALVADIGDKNAIYPMAGIAAALAGPVDILINNASQLGPVPLRLIMDTDCEDFEQTLQVNTIGPMRLMKAVVGSMILRKTGTVINISSDAAIEAYPTWGVYSASKAALDHLTRIMAAELSETALKFFSIDPGEMNTRMHRDAIPQADPHSLRSLSQVAEKIISIIENASSLQSGSRIKATQWEAGHASSPVYQI